MKQSKRYHLSLCVCGILASLVCGAGAAPVLIDFGRPDNETTGAADTYNNPHLDPTVPPVRSDKGDWDSGVLGLVDTSNAATPWSIQIETIQAGEAALRADVVAAHADISGFEQTAWEDGMFVSTDGEVTVSITGLNDALTYDLLFYGSRGRTNTSQTWSITKGSGGGDVTHDSLNNTTTVVDWDGISPDGNGEIEFTVAVTTASGSLNFGSITEGSASSTASITSITSLDGDLWELTLKGEPNTDYNFAADPSLAFAPGTVIENLVQGDGADPGTISGTNDEVFTTDGSGDGTVQVTLSGTMNFVAAQIPPPVPPVTLIDEDFESGAGGFTAVNTTGTIWAVGVPNSDGEAGGGAVTGGAGGVGTNCWGTDLGDITLGGGEYEIITDTSLISTVIDLTGEAGATLSFAQALDIMSGDTLIVNVIDDTTDVVIESAIHTSTPDPDDQDAGWATVDSIAIAGGQAVRIEWRFVGNSNSDGSYIGGYIDDVKVTVP